MSNTVIVVVRGGVVEAVNTKGVYIVIDYDEWETEHPMSCPGCDAWDGLLTQDSPTNTNLEIATRIFIQEFIKTNGLCPVCLTVYHKDMDIHTGELPVISSEINRVFGTE